MTYIDEFDDKHDPFYRINEESEVSYISFLLAKKLRVFLVGCVRHEVVCVSYDKEEGYSLTIRYGVCGVENILIEKNMYPFLIEVGDWHGEEK